MDKVAQAAYDWLLGAAAAFAKAKCLDHPILPIFDAAELLGGGGVTPGPLPRQCPTGCSEATCNAVYNDFSPSWDACTDGTCRAQVLAAYQAALAIACGNN